MSTYAYPTSPYQIQRIDWWAPSKRNTTSYLFKQRQPDNHANMYTFSYRATSLQFLSVRNSSCNAMEKCRLPLTRVAAILDFNRPLTVAVMKEFHQAIHVFAKASNTAHRVPWRCEMRGQHFEKSMASDLCCLCVAYCVWPAEHSCQNNWTYPVSSAPDLELWTLWRRGQTCCCSRLERYLVPI